jgi:hypothetical protein
MSLFRKINSLIQTLKEVISFSEKEKISITIKLKNVILIKIL